VKAGSGISHASRCILKTNAWNHFMDKMELLCYHFS